MKWLSQPLVHNGTKLADGFDVERLTDSDLKEICHRMKAIMHTIEHGNCEGRYLPLELFELIDDLASRLTHGPRPRLVDWTAVIEKFGSHYLRDVESPIEVDPVSYEKTIL